MGGRMREGPHTFGGHDQEDEAVTDELEGGGELRVQFLDVGADGILRFLRIREVLVGVVVPHVNELAPAADAGITSEPVVEIAQSIVHARVCVSDVAHESIELRAVTNERLS